MKLPKLPRYIWGLSAVGTAVGFYVLLKDTSGGYKYEGHEKLVGKTVVITGATSGIGKSTAEDLAIRGGRIIMACRDMEKCARVSQELIASTSNVNIYCRKLDLASLQSIREFVQSFENSESRLDILINNAGVLCKDRSVTSDGFELTLGVNFLGRFLLTNLLLNKMINNPEPSRIVNLLCFGYKDARIDFDDFNSELNFSAKNASKIATYANVLFTDSLAKKLKGSSVNVFAVNPGLAETSLRREFGSHKSYISGFLLKPLFVTLFKSARQATQTVIYCSLDSSLGAQSSGKLFCDCEEEFIGSKRYNEKISNRLWATAEVWTQLKSINMFNTNSDTNLNKT
ncbi:hypothetical protein HELRODRAFT_88758 [Helobdella robusta]|uniref:Retinol dehydrogenase 13 n=1 Tax=Helobdella robusta TaxID=6412 RepID=T1G760_HELRO|nr:hypothetical protein HELRODRAFT_88758 [Helobdella robusta]ESN93390.1 hypothetical protein HELRODRAFT_88758 [Helobdella robusta]